MRKKQEIEWSKLTEEQLKIVNYYYSRIYRRTN